MLSDDLRNRDTHAREVPQHDLLIAAQCCVQVLELDPALRHKQPFDRHRANHVLEFLLLEIVLKVAVVELYELIMVQANCRLEPVHVLLRARVNGELHAVPFYELLLVLENSVEFLHLLLRSQETYLFLMLDILLLLGYVELLHLLLLVLLLQHQLPDVLNYAVNAEIFLQLGVDIDQIVQNLL